MPPLGSSAASMPLIFFSRFHGQLTKKELRGFSVVSLSIRLLALPIVMIGPVDPSSKIRLTLLLDLPMASPRYLYYSTNLDLLGGRQPLGGVTRSESRARCLVRPHRSSGLRSTYLDADAHGEAVALL